MQIDDEIKVREFRNDYLHQNDRQIFKEFTLKNYPGVKVNWNNDDIEFYVFINRKTKYIEGLIAMYPYDGDKMHIKFITVDTEYRKKGLGTKMLIFIAAKYPTYKITLNVMLDELNILPFYYRKKYAKYEETCPEMNLVVLSLVNCNLLAELPLPSQD